ncbi:hypothetical protein [Halorubrum ezzemoulense]|uniref:hypothetical protein n=1 Tax=Halorubrum ezzemoulense TaxID=337243 RepID=UPI00232CED44|nr:hypothetical protein [Halorubrum ezzemoulense]MDB9253999.1 hypothetical protein [Halorubrum ezzemoulense]MDB9257475.1 hypothetical protein [Halorubrum ezzemoulense]MDB9278122.1 hypothetical protein [Halorubrum ezzemoulense]
MDRSSKSQLLVSGGSLLLVFQLIVFQGAFNIVESSGVSGRLRGVLSGGLYRSRRIPAASAAG